LDQGRGVVDTVADHGHDTTFQLQSLDLGDLLPREDLGQHPTDFGLAGYGVRGSRIVTGDHHDLEAHLLELAHRTYGIGLEDIGDGKDSAQLTGPAGENDRSALALQLTGSFLEVCGDRQAGLCHQAAATDPDPFPVLVAVDTASGNLDETDHGRPSQAGLVGTVDHGPSHGVLAGHFDGGRVTEQ